jgi:hypothetical protein
MRCPHVSGVGGHVCNHFLFHRLGRGCAAQKHDASTRPFHVTPVSDEAATAVCELTLRCDPVYAGTARPQRGPWVSRRRLWMTPFLQTAHKQVESTKHRAKHARAIICYRSQMWVAYSTV